MVLMITYDLNKVKDYKKLYAAIENLGTTKRDVNLDSVWFVSTSYNPEQASNHIRKATDKDDTHFVCRVQAANCEGLLNKEVWTFIKNNE